MGTNKNKIFYFYFGFWKVQKAIAHSEDCLPELDTDLGFRKSAGFCNRVE